MPAVGLGALGRSLRAVSTTPHGRVHCAATALTIGAKLLRCPAVEKLTKPLIVPPLLWPLRQQIRAGNPDAGLVGVGALGHTAGDVVLMLGSGEHTQVRQLITGSACFGAGHLALGTVLLRSGARLRWQQVLPRAVAVVGAVGVLRAVAPQAALPLGGYAAVLATYSALAADVPGDSDASRGMAGGGVLFLISDALIVARQQVAADSIAARLLDAAVIGTYGAAQAALYAGFEANLTSPQPS